MTMLEDLREVVRLADATCHPLNKADDAKRMNIEADTAATFLRKYASQIEQDARDAERVEWMDDNVTAIVCGKDFISVGNVIGYFREIIDAAMAKESGNG